MCLYFLFGPICLHNEPDDVVYIGTTTSQSPQKLYKKSDDVVYIGATTPQSSQKQPDDVIYIGTITSQSSQKRKAQDHLPSNTRTKKSRFDDNSPHRTAYTSANSHHESKSNQRENDELAQSSTYKKRKKPGDDNDRTIKPLLPPPPLPPPPLFDSFMSQLTILPPIPSINENSQPKRFKSSSMEFNGKACKIQAPSGNNEYAAELQPPPRFDENTGKISQYECKANPESTSLRKDFKNQTENISKLGNNSGSGSYNNNRFNKDTESYQHLPCSRYDLPERISPINRGIKAQLDNSKGDNYKVPKRSRFSESIESGNRSNLNSENSLLNSPQLILDSDGPIQQFGGNNKYRSDSSKSFSGNYSLNKNIGKFNQHENQYSNSRSRSYNLSKNNGSVGNINGDNSSFINNIYKRDPANTEKGYNNGTSGNTSMFGSVKDTFVQRENNQHISSNNRFTSNTDNSGNSYNQNNDSNFRNSYSGNLSPSLKQFETNRNPNNAGFMTNTENLGNKYNSSNDRQSEKSAGFTSSTQDERKQPGYAELKNDSGNNCSQVSYSVSSKNVSLPAENKGDFGTNGSQQLQNKERFVVAELQGNTRKCETFNSSGDISFPKNVSQFVENTSLKSSDSINQTNAYNYNTGNNHQPKYGYSKTFSQFDGNTSLRKSSVDYTKQAEYQSNTGTLGNNHENKNDSVEKCSQLNKIKSFQNITQQMDNEKYPGNSRFHENTVRNNNIKSNYNNSNEKNTLLKLPLNDGEFKSLEYKQNLQRNAMPYSSINNNNNMQFDNSCSAGNSSQLGPNNSFENFTHSKNENTDINGDPKNIQFGMKRRTTSMKTNYQHNNEIDKIFGNKVSSHQEKLGLNNNGNSETATSFVSQLGHNPNFYNINPAPPVPDFTKPPPPLPHLANSAVNTSSNNPYMNSNNFQPRRQNTDQRFGNKNHFRENIVRPRQNRGFGRNINRQNVNNNSGTRYTRTYGGNMNGPRLTRQFAGNNGPGVRKGPEKFVGQNSNRTNINRFKPNASRNSIYNSTMNNRLKQTFSGTCQNKRHEKQPNKFAALLKLVKTKYATRPKDPAKKKEKLKKLKKIKKSKQKPSGSTNPKSDVGHIDVNKQLFGDFVPIKVGLKKPAKGHLKPKPEIYWKEWWSLYGYVEKSIKSVDPNDADVKSTLNFLLSPTDHEFRKKKRILLVMGVAKILRHIKLNESDYALRDIFSVLKYKHQLEDPRFQQNLNAKEEDRVEKVLKHARKKTRRALFYQNMICRWHFSALLLKRANTGEACLKCGHARKLMNDKAFNYLVWESIQELKKLIAEDWPEFEQYYKSL